jgi:hypothetical protein
MPVSDRPNDGTQALLGFLKEFPCVGQLGQHLVAARLGHEFNWGRTDHYA